MDLFGSRYYWLNRKLLSLIGQWPYESQTSRVQKIIVVLSIVFSMTVVQIAKLATSKITLDLCCQIFSCQAILLICIIKYFNYSVNNNKVKGLLEVIKSDWKSLTNGIENKIAHEMAEECRLYNLFCTLYMYSAILVILFAAMLPSILDVIMPINGSHPRAPMVPIEYFVDEEKYYYPILFHITITATVLITILNATDTLYVVCIYHACAMFNVVSHRLEHAFDKCDSGKESRQDRKSETCVRIVDAVTCHRNATEYTEDINSAYGTAIFMTLLLALINISVSMYCTVISWEDGDASVTALMMAVSQTVHLMVMDYPPQKLLDSSATICLKAYSGKWYKGPIKMQSLLIPIMMRSMKPSMIVAGSIICLTLESCCTIYQSSVSYFTVLMSFR